MKPQTEAQFKAAVTWLEKGTASDTERALIRAMIYAPLSPAEAALIKDPEPEAKLRAAVARLKAEKATDADEIFVSTVRRNITGKTRSRINIGRKYGRAVRREFRGAGSRLEIPECFGRPYLHPYSVAAVRFIPDIASQANSELRACAVAGSVSVSSGGLSGLDDPPCDTCGKPIKPTDGRRSDC